MPIKPSVSLVNRDVKPASSAPATAPAPVGDAHSNLMAAIRQAGGAGRAKLRSASESTPQKVTYTDAIFLIDSFAGIVQTRSRGRHQGQLKERTMFLVSKSLTLSFAPPWAGGIIWWLSSISKKRDRQLANHSSSFSFYILDRVVVILTNSS